MRTVVWVGGLAVALFLRCETALAETSPARQTFAYALAAAFVAEKNCEMPEEVERAQRWIDRFRSGFRTLENREDNALVITAAARVEVQRLRMGTHAWCVEYRARRNFSPF